MSTVPSYCGQNQQSTIKVPKRIAYKQVWEESCWPLPPLVSIYPDVWSEQNPPQYTGVVPLPIYKTDLWCANQTFPL